MIGRKSIISHEQNIITHETKGKISVKEDYESFVIDICGAHKPVSRFLEEETFENGIWFVLWVQPLGEIVAVSWSGSYDALRTIYGTDENMTGRGCILTSASSKKIDLQYGTISFNETRRSAYQDEQRNTYTSIGGFFGIVGNYESQLISYESNSEEGAGESWRPFK